MKQAKGKKTAAPPAAPPQPPPAEHLCIRPYAMFANVYSIPAVLMQYEGISPGAKLVYMVMARFAKHRTYCYAGLKKIGPRVGVTRIATLSDWRKELVNDGFLASERKGQGKDNVYHFLQHAIFDQMTNQPPDDFEPENHPEEEDEPLDGEIGEGLANQWDEHRKSRFTESVNQDSRKAEIKTYENRKSGHTESVNPSKALHEERSLKKTSSSAEYVPTAPETRTTVNQNPDDDELLKPISRALAPWRGGAEDARQVWEAARREDPEIPPAAVAAVVAAMAPADPDYELSSPAAFFTASVRKFITGEYYPALRPHWTEPGGMAELEVIASRQHRNTPRVFRTAVAVLLQYRAELQPAGAPAEPEPEPIDTAEYEAAKDEFIGEQIRAMQTAGTLEDRLKELGAAAMKANPQIRDRMSRQQWTALVSDLLRAQLAGEYPEPARWQELRDGQSRRFAETQAARKKAGSVNSAAGGKKQPA